MSQGRVVARTLDELLVGATSREPLKTADSKSSASFERVVIDGAPYIVKVVDGSSDWLAIASDDRTGRAVGLFESGGYGAVPDCIDHTVVGAARLGAGDAPYPCALLMRDVTDSLIAEDAPVDLDTHAAFLDAMAQLHARFAGAPPETTYMPLVQTYRMLSPVEARRQVGTGTAGDVQRMIEPGWQRVSDEAPDLHAAVAPLLDDPQPLADALLEGPTTFLHGDWKMGNLGRHRDGRVVLLDWDRPTVGPGLVDLAWYLAVNADRLPETKDDAVSRYRSVLESLGVPTGEWWDRHLPLALLGAFLTLGWSKGGQPAELAWWGAAVMRARQDSNLRPRA